MLSCKAIALKQQCDRAVAADTALQQTLAELADHYREEVRLKGLVPHSAGFKERMMVLVQN